MKKMKFLGIVLSMLAVVILWGCGGDNREAYIEELEGLSRTDLAALEDWLDENDESLNDLFTIRHDYVDVEGESLNASQVSELDIELFDRWDFEAEEDGDRLTFIYTWDYAAFMREYYAQLIIEQLEELDRTNLDALNDWLDENEELLDGLFTIGNDYVNAEGESLDYTSEVSELGDGRFVDWDFEISGGDLTFTKTWNNEDFPVDMNGFFENGTYVIRVERDWDDDRERRDDTLIDIDQDLVIEIRENEDAERLEIVVENNSEHALFHVVLEGYVGSEDQTFRASAGSGSDILMSPGITHYESVLRQFEVEIEELSHLVLTRIVVGVFSDDITSYISLEYDVETDIYTELDEFSSPGYIIDNWSNGATGDDDDDDDDDDSSSSTPSGSNSDWRQFLQDYDAFMTRFINDPTNLDLMTESLEWTERVLEIQDSLDGQDFWDFTEEALRISGRALE